MNGSPVVERLLLELRLDAVVPEPYTRARLHWHLALLALGRIVGTAAAVVLLGILLGRH